MASTARRRARRRTRARSGRFSLHIVTFRFAPDGHVTRFATILIRGRMDQGAAIGLAGKAAGQGTVADRHQHRASPARHPGALRPGSCTNQPQSTRKTVMPRRTPPTHLDQIEDAIRRAGSIGELERLAGVGTTLDERAAFWAPFCKMPAAQSLDAGVAELKRRIRAQAQPQRSQRHTRAGSHG